MARCGFVIADSPNLPEHVHGFEALEELRIVGWCMGHPEDLTCFGSQVTVSGDTEGHDAFLIVSIQPILKLSRAKYIGRWLVTLSSHVETVHNRSAVSLLAWYLRSSTDTGISSAKEISLTSFGFKYGG
jgi:hypothetical protein